MYAEPMEREAEVLFPAKLNRSSLLVACKQIEASEPMVARVLRALLGETQRAEAAEQRCKALEREVHRLANWMQGAVCQFAELEQRLEKAGIPALDAEDDFMAGVEPVATKCERHGLWSSPEKPCSMCAPSVASLRDEPRLVYLRRAETVRPTVGEIHSIAECVYPCIIHDREAFTEEWAQNEARRLNVRESA